jgi:methyltransferase (TIGR00027 family)
MVAVEQRFPPGQRILDDQLAGLIVPFGTRACLSLMGPRVAAWMVAMAERKYPGLWGGILCRKCYIDERLMESINQITALINLGAGFDTRVYRLASVATIPVWEVDLPENIEAKRRRLRELFEIAPKHVTLVPIDFERQTLGTALATCGYSISQRTFFIWEGVTQYMTEPGVRKTLDFLATAAPGSRLAFTYVCKDFLEGQSSYGQESVYERYVMKERIWRFGLDPLELEDFLEPYRWRVIGHPDPTELAERYIKPTGRALKCMPIERLVYAEKM